MGGGPTVTIKAPTIKKLSTWGGGGSGILGAEASRIGGGGSGLQGKFEPVKGVEAPNIKLTIDRKKGVFGGGGGLVDAMGLSGVGGGGSGIQGNWQPLETMGLSGLAGKDTGEPTVAMSTPLGDAPIQPTIDEAYNALQGRGSSPIKRKRGRLSTIMGGGEDNPNVSRPSLLG